MRLLAAVLAGGLALALPAPALAGPLLAPEDAAELANSLAEARVAQGVCYGWNVSVADESTGTTSSDLGSDRGPNVPVGGANCKRSVVFQGNLTYTSEFSESEDSASVSIIGNLAKLPSPDDLEALGYETSDLLGDNDDTTLVNMVGALPQIAAERNGLRPVAFEPAATPPAERGRPTGDQGSDFMRQNGPALGLGAVLVLIGLGWLVYSLARSRPVQANG